VTDVNINNKEGRDESKDFEVSAFLEKVKKNS